MCYVGSLSQAESSLPAFALPPDSDPAPQALLLARQREYKAAALNAKRAGDVDRARELMRIGKVRHPALFSRWGSKGRGQTTLGESGLVDLFQATLLELLGLCL